MDGVLIWHDDTGVQSSCYDSNDLSYTYVYTLGS